jgi:hypothetical protein
VSKLFNAFGTAFVVVGFLCAPVAALATFVAYVFVSPRGQEGRSIAAGLLVAVVAAAVIGWLYERNYQRASDVYPEQYRSLLQRLRSARIRLDVCKPATPQPLVAAAQQDAEGLAGDLDTLLNERKAGATWISAAGYLEAWSDVNRLEEQMTFLLPLPQVLAVARDDLSRLDGSQIPQATALRDRLNADLASLTGADDLSARADLVLVRHAINRWREDQWAKLVGARNLTMLAAAIAGVIAYVGLLSVVVWHIDPKALQVATAFIITGALISLLHQVTVVGLSDSAVEDFGQATARLLAATFVSGLIALLGIIVLQGMGLTINGVSMNAPFSRWRQTFDWTQNKSGFFWAAVFGLAPSLLFQMLQAQIDTIKTSLESSKATGGAAK